MADLKNVQPLNDFDWDAFEKGTFNEDKIEVISEYKQGVAIVKKNNLFGAIINSSLKFEIMAKQLYVASQRVL